MTINTKYEKPIPLKTEDNRPYWDAADRHELAVQKCTDCQTYLHPPGPACSKCGSQAVEWENLGSDIKATLYSYIISYRPFLPGFQHDLPTIIAQAALDGRPEVRIMCNLLECKPEDVQIGMPVQMIWQDITEERALPQWKPTD
ncbi:OB-fold domain-containing protein [Sporosarcina sp. 179-K 3D1 HS]|uniref:Zn-ribbon domain-containing OB-fold protein n=1 Tax=Sporosarcina sp. 179-K 3D1 HS TaxID=3232169 RepID=UPI0039A1B2E5